MPHLDFQLLLHGEYRDWLLGGFFFSLQLTALTLLLALPLALVIAILRLAPSRAKTKPTFSSTVMESNNAAP